MRTPKGRVEVLTDESDVEDIVEREFVRVILLDETEGGLSTTLATVEHHFLEQLPEGGVRDLWRHRTILRREPISDDTAMRVAKEYAVHRGIACVYLRRESWSTDTVVIRRPKLD